MPKKAVALFFLLAFIGAALFVYFTFPRTKAQIPKSNNQRAFPTSPVSSPSEVPVPETVPRPNAPTVPPGPTLHAMAWASSEEARSLTARANAFGTATGRSVSLTSDSDMASYRRDLREALASDSPPDLCFISGRDFCGIDPRELVDVKPTDGSAPRALAAFTVDGHVKAVPSEYSVDVLFYNSSHFDQAGIGYPGPHWTWDILEADARALQSLKLKDASGHGIYPLELPADFDFWNLLCSQTGRPALDLDVWHLADPDTKDPQMRALDFIHEIFQGLSVTAPLGKPGEPAGQYFAQGRASLLIAPSYLTATLPSFPYSFTLLPRDLAQASLAYVNGWAVPAKSSQGEAARVLAAYFATQPIHQGWNSVQKPPKGDSPENVCYTALDQAVIPRLEPRSQKMAQFLDQQIDLLARNAQTKTEVVYAKIQTEYQNNLGIPPIFDTPTKPVPKAGGAGQLRGL